MAEQAAGLPALGTVGSLGSPRVDLPRQMQVGFPGPVPDGFQPLRWAGYSGPSSELRMDPLTAVSPRPNHSHPRRAGAERCLPVGAKGEIEGDAARGLAGFWEPAAHSGPRVRSGVRQPWAWATRQGKRSVPPFAPG